MNLREVREAADRLHNGWHSHSPKLLGDYETVCDFVLATIHADDHLPITAGSLEEFGFAEFSGMWQHKDITGTFCLSDGTLSWWHTGNKTAEIRNKYQFRKLVEAIGTYKIKQVSEC